MAELKTKATTQDPKDFLNTIEPKQKREDGFVLLEIFQEVTKEKPVMWGPSIIGFGKYHYKSERSKQEGDWPIVGFSPRKQKISLYLSCNDTVRTKLLTKLGKHVPAKGCVYINKLADINVKVLEELIKVSYKEPKTYSA